MRLRKLFFIATFSFLLVGCSSTESTKKSSITPSIDNAESNTTIVDTNDSNTSTAVSESNDVTTSIDNDPSTSDIVIDETPLEYNTDVSKVKYMDINRKTEFTKEIPSDAKYITVATRSIIKREKGDYISFQSHRVGRKSLVRGAYFCLLEEMTDYLSLLFDNTYEVAYDDTTKKVYDVRETIDGTYFFAKLRKVDNLYYKIPFDDGEIIEEIDAYDGCFEILEVNGISIEELNSTIFISPCCFDKDFMCKNVENYSTGTIFYGFILNEIHTGLSPEYKFDFYSSTLYHDSVLFDFNPYEEGFTHDNYWYFCEDPVAHNWPCDEGLFDDYNV